MQLFQKLAVSSLAIVSLTTNALASQDCISFFQGANPPAWEGLESSLSNGRAEVTIKHGDLFTGKGTRSGNPYYRRANNECNDNSTALFTDRSNLYISITPVQAKVIEVEIDYCSFGGIENVSMQFDPVEYIGDIEGVHGKRLTDTFGQANPVEVRNLNSFRWGNLGDVVLRSNDIREIVVGGEELFINRICFTFQK